MVIAPAVSRKEAIRTNDEQKVCWLVRENNRLLAAIGVVLVFADTPPTALCEKHGYTVSPVRGDPLGTRMV